MPIRVRGGTRLAQGAGEAPLSSSTLHSGTKAYAPSRTSLLGPILTPLPRALLRPYRKPSNALTETPYTLLPRPLIRSYREPSYALTESPLTPLPRALQRSYRELLHALTETPYTLLPRAPLCTHVYTRVYTRVYSSVHTCTPMPSHQAPSYALTKSTNSLSKRAHTCPALTACYVL